MRPLIAITVILAAGVAGAANRDLFSVGNMQLGGASKCERCIRRCEREVCGTPLPSPSPTATPQPLPCEPIAGTKTYATREEKMLCFTMSGPPPPFVEVQSRNHGNASCAEMVAHLTAPDGTQRGGYGAQPGAVAPRMAGRYYFFTKLIWASEQPGCDTYTFTVK